MYRLLLASVLATGCTTGGGGGSSVDAAPDGPVVPVVTLDQCPSSVAGTVQDSPTMFIPQDTTISVGQVVKFVITAEHFVIPNTLKSTDPALSVPRGTTKCFRFNVPGTYNFLCAVHSFPGSIIVQ
jgi:plastocyanin